MSLNYKTLMTINEAAEYLHLQVSRLRYEVFIKRIPHIKIGRSIRFSQTQLDSWIEANSKNGENK